MPFGRPGGNDGGPFEIDDRHSRLQPECRPDPVSHAVGKAGVWITVFGKDDSVDPGFFRPRRHDGNGIAPSARNNKVSRIDGHTARDKLCKLHTAVLAQVPVVEVKSVNDLLLATAGKEL